MMSHTKLLLIILLTPGPELLSNYFRVKYPREMIDFTIALIGAIIGGMAKLYRDEKSIKPKFR